MLVTEVFITSITLRAYMGSRKWTMPSIFSKAFNIISFSSYPRVRGTELLKIHFYMCYCSCYFACYNKKWYQSKHALDVLLFKKLLVKILTFCKIISLLTNRLQLDSLSFINLSQIYTCINLSCSKYPALFITLNFGA